MLVLLSSLLKARSLCWLFFKIKTVLELHFLALSVMASLTILAKISWLGRHVAFATTPYLLVMLALETTTPMSTCGNFL